jgi:hypothetical protein
MDTSSDSESIDSIGIRKNGCPGFIIYYCRRGSVIEESNNPPPTSICTHDFYGCCEAGAEFKFAMQVAVRQGEISSSLYWSSYPRDSTSKTHGRGRVLRNSIKVSNCPGFSLCEKNVVTPNGSRVQPGIHVDPIFLEPYTKPCLHKSGECQPEAYEKYALIRLIATDCMDEDVLRCIETKGWRTRMDTATTCSLEQIPGLLFGDIDFGEMEKYMWRPSKSPEY